MITRATWGYLPYIVMLFAPRLALAAVTAQVTANGATRTLTVTGDAAPDTITLACDATGNVKINGADPSTGAVTCASITAIVVNGGDGNDNIDLKGVLHAAFTSTPSVSIDAGPGDDLVVGSVLNDVIVGGPGNDTLHGGVGDDDLAGQDGNDVLHGNQGDDILRLSPESGRDHLDGESGDDQVIVTASAGDDQLQVFDDPTIVETTHNHIDVRGTNLWARVGLVECLVINLGDGNDTISATLFPNEKLELHGEGGNDTLTFSGQCAAGTLTAGSYSQPSQQPATFDGFEKSEVSNDVVVGNVSLDVPANENTVDVTLTIGASCAWTASTTDGWISLPQTSGTGPVSLPVTIAANPATDVRVGTVKAAGLVVTITQAGYVSKEQAPPPGSAPKDSETIAGGPFLVGGCSATRGHLPILLALVFLLMRARRVRGR